ncbi:MAG TPA: hypothetical protein VJQ48_05560, partial [Candidatus Binatia bacterium]|nr:hypothetical protein [Candidatus Binatia bacterium]
YSVSGKLSLASFRELNLPVETTPIANVSVPAAFSGDELRANRYGGNWHTKKSFPELKRRIRELLV